MRDGGGKIIYVGKARNLKKRVKNYFRKECATRYQIEALMQNVSDIEYIETPTEKEAILLEYRLIQEHKPRYNIQYKDNKSYISIRISPHNFPGIYATRRILKDRSQYFGPYTSAAIAKELTKLITEYFRIRICRDAVFSNRSRPCLQYEIKRCDAPCVGYVSKERYKKGLEAALMLLRGDIGELIKTLTAEMDEASREMRFEDAARMRDVIRGIKNEVLPPSPNPSLEGRGTSSIPSPCGRGILSIPSSPRGGAFSISSPLGGEGGVRGSTLAAKFFLPSEPHTIECVDISNISGKHAVGSIVSFKNGRPNKQNYRRYKIKTLDTPDDYEMMNEVLIRRFREPPPDLLLVDGGKGQLAIALAVLEKLQIKIPVVAIAKGKDRKQDQIFIPNRKNPVKFGSNNPAYLFIKKVRDEAHRFGISYYRKRHRLNLIASELDDIPGIGPVKKQALLKKFGSIEAIRNSSIEELMKVKGISRVIAQRLSNVGHQHDA